MTDKEYVLQIFPNAYCAFEKKLNQYYIRSGKKKTSFCYISWWKPTENEAWQQAKIAIDAQMMRKFNIGL